MINVRNWVQKNITGGGERDYSTIKQDLDRLQNQVDELKKPVDVSLNGSYADLSKRDKFVLGAGAGAVVGGGLGLMRGFLANAGDGMKLNVAWDTHVINTPKVEFDPIRSGISGTSTVATADGLRQVEVKNATIRYDFQSRVTNEKVGEYRTPGEVTVGTSHATAAAVSALGGAVAGAVIGVGVTAVAMALNKKPASEHETIQVDFGNTKKTLAIYAGVGVGVGAGIGALDGMLEQSRMSGLSDTVTWETPIMKEGVKIGDVPKSASVMVRQDVSYPADAFNGSELYRNAAKFDLQQHIKHGPKVEVTGSAPERTLFGGVKMEEHTQTYHAQARYNVATSVALGALAGGVLGLAAGVTANTLQKMIEV